MHIYICIYNQLFGGKHLFAGAEDDKGPGGPPTPSMGPQAAGERSG